MHCAMWNKMVNISFLLPPSLMHFLWRHYMQGFIPFGLKVICHCFRGAFTALWESPASLTSISNSTHKMWPKLTRAACSSLLSSSGNVWFVWSVDAEPGIPADLLRHTGILIKCTTWHLTLNGLGGLLYSLRSSITMLEWVRAANFVRVTEVERGRDGEVERKKKTDHHWEKTSREVKQ